MNVSLQPGKYVLAVSGGVDSVALLDMIHQLRQQSGEPIKIIVAHFDHGIRSDSVEDRRHVQALARQYDLPFVYDEARLGAGASEAAARQARYDFLHRVRNISGSRAIVTAHHHDDALETAILNILRGTGRKGLTALGSQPYIERPLLAVPKQDILAYAQSNGLVWREDSTNQNQALLRNYIRHSILPRLNEQARSQLKGILIRQQSINQQLDTLLVNLLHNQSQGGMIDRSWFNSLPHTSSKEVMAAWLRANGVRDFDRKTLERLVVAAKTSEASKDYSLLNGRVMKIGQNHLALTSLER